MYICGDVKCKIMKANEETADLMRDIYYPLLKKSSVTRLASILIPMSLKKNDILLRESEISDRIYFVKTGLLRQHYYKNDKDLTEHFASENTSIMSIESFIFQEPSYLIIEAMEPTELFAIPREPLMSLARKHADLGLLYTRIVECILVGIQRKIESIRSQSAVERFLHFKTECPKLFTRVPLLYIASYLLMSPETLSRIRSVLLTET